MPTRGKLTRDLRTRVATIKVSISGDRNVRKSHRFWACAYVAGSWHNVNTCAAGPNPRVATSRALQKLVTRGLRQRKGAFKGRR